jgi:hypothetical protein
MPYADPEKQREARARWYRSKYKSDANFAAQESARKADWLQTDEGKASNAAASARARTMKQRAHFVTRFLQVA